MLLLKGQMASGLPKCQNNSHGAPVLQLGPLATLIAGVYFMPEKQSAL